MPAPRDVEGGEAVRRRVVTHSCHPNTQEAEICLQVEARFFFVLFLFFGSGWGRGVAIAIRKKEVTLKMVHRSGIPALVRWKNQGFEASLSNTAN